MARTTPIRLGILGASDKTRQTLEYLFKSHAQGSYDLGTVSNPQILLIDLDGVNAIGEWHAYHERHPDKPAVGFSVTDNRVDGIATHLKKPLQSSVLIKALDALAKNIDTPSMQMPGQVNRPPSTPAHSKTVVSEERDLDSTQEIDRAELDRVLQDIARRSNVDQRPVLERTIALHEETGTSRSTTINSQLEATVPETAAYESTPAEAGQGDDEASASLTADDVLDVTQFSQMVKDEDVDLSRFIEFCGESPDIDPYNSEQVESVLFDREQTLLDLLIRTRVQVMDSLKDRYLYLQGEHSIRLTADGYIQTDMIDEQLKALCAGPVTAVSPQIAVDDVEQSLPIQMEQEQFIWKVALWTSRGRLPRGTGLNDKVCLKYWPNMTRLIELPDALRIVALWMVQPMTLIHTAEALNIPQRHVYALFTACQSLGLIELEQPRTDLAEPEPEPEPPKPRRTRILHMMARHLGLLRKQADE